MAGETAELDVRLPVGERISGLLRDAAGYAVAGVDVELEIEPETAGAVTGVGDEPEITLKTDEEGRFELLDVPTGVVIIAVNKSGFSPERQVVPTARGSATLS